MYYNINSNFIYSNLTQHCCASASTKFIYKECNYNRVLLLHTQRKARLHCIALHRYRAAMHPFKFKYQIPMHMHGKLGRHDIIYHIITIVPHMQYAHTMTMYMPLSTMKISLYLNFTTLHSQDFKISHQRLAHKGKSRKSQKKPNRPFPTTPPQPAGINII